MPSTRRPSWVVAMAGLAVVGVAIPSTADEPKADRVDPAARRFFQEIAATYKGLAAFEAEGEQSFVPTIDGKPRPRTAPMTIRFVRPDRIAMINGPVRIVGDGRTLRSVVEPFRQYSEVASPLVIGFDSIKGNPALGPLIGGIDGFPLVVLFSLLTEDDAVKTLTMGSSGMKLEADRRVEGKTLRCLFVDWARGPGYRLLVDPETRLVHGVELVHPLELFNSQVPAASRASELSVSWKARSIRTRLPAADAFAFRPPQGFTRVDQASVMERPLEPGEIRPPAGFNEQVMEEMKACQAMLGQPAPDFTVAVLDGPGKTRRVRKDDLAGGVFAIIVWPASLEGPFRDELAKLQASAEIYDKAKKKVVILFLPQDNRPADPETIRAQVEQVLAASKIRLPAGNVGLVALDPTLSIGRSCHITALPTIIVADGKGIIRAVHIGFMENSRETLDREIDTLLAGKTLPVPEAGKAEK